MILVDTSVWIAVFRRWKPVDLESLIDVREIVTCLPVFQEVLQGFDDERAWRVARESMSALPIVESPLRQEVVELAVDLYRRARRAAFTIRSSIDCLIAACALRNDLEVFHDDRDFDALARVCGLTVRRLGS